MQAHLGWAPNELPRAPDKHVAHIETIPKHSTNVHQGATPVTLDATHDGHINHRAQHRTHSPRRASDAPQDRACSTHAGILPEESGTLWIRRARCKASSANGRHISHSTQQLFIPSVYQNQTPKLNFGSLDNISHIDSTTPCDKATISRAASKSTCCHSTHSSASPIPANVSPKYLNVRPSEQNL